MVSIEVSVKYCFKYQLNIGLTMWVLVKYRLNIGKDNNIEKSIGKECLNIG